MYGDTSRSEDEKLGPNTRLRTFCAITIRNMESILSSEYSRTRPDIYTVTTVLNYSVPKQRHIVRYTEATEARLEVEGDMHSSRDT